MKRLRVVAGLVLREDKVLLARRSPTMSLPGVWEFPGGKIEAGEGAGAALERELDEELGVTVRALRELAVSELPQGDRLLCLEGWLAELVAGEPEAREHDALCWLRPGEVARDTLAPADLPLLDALLSLEVGAA